MEILGGPLFGVAGAGESHGPAYTTIVFGCPSGLYLERAQIQRYLDRRRPGGASLGTSRREKDQVILTAGLYQENHERLTAGPSLSVDTDGAEGSIPTYEAGYTTGEPIAALVLSGGAHTGDYSQFMGPRGDVRPGHADLVKYYQSQGFADPRGGGRSSYRATISDVIGGAVARIFLNTTFQTVFLSNVIQVGTLKARETLAHAVEAVVNELTQRRPLPRSVIATWQRTLETMPFPTLDAAFAAEAAQLIERVRGEGESVGAVVEVVGVNVPPLVGSPLYQSLKLRLMGALGGLNAAQSCEIGSGLEAVERTGSEHNDPIRSNGFRANHHGGVLGGITTGMPLVCRVGFKPTASIRKPQLSVRKDLTEVAFRLQKGRHDPCVGIRAGITLESRMAIEVMNAVLMHQAQHVGREPFVLFNRSG